MAAKKVVLLLGLHENDAREKRKVLKAVSTFPGLDLIAVDMKESKLTVVGLVDPIELVTKLRKLWHAEILSVGPAKEDRAAAAAAAAAGEKRETGGGAAAAGGAKEECDGKGKHEVVTPARQAGRERPVDMRSWPHAAVHVYPPPPRPRYPPHPYHPHQYGAQETKPHGSYVAYGHGAQENHNHPNPYYYYVAPGHGHGARENHPPSYYVAYGHGAQGENPPNACAIC